MLLRPGKAAAYDVDDHIDVLELALAQLPVAPLGLDPGNGVAMLVRADTAGSTHKFVDALVERGIEFSSIPAAGATRSSSPTRPTPTSPISRPADMGHARVEDRIRCAKDTGLRNLPFPDFANNACWV